MKTNLDINGALLAKAKEPAAGQRTSKTLLRATHPAARRTLPVFVGCGGLVAGVNPLSNRALRAAVGDGA